MNEFNLAPTAPAPYDPVAALQAQAVARRATMPAIAPVIQPAHPEIPALINMGQQQGAAAKDPWTSLLESTRPTNIDAYNKAADYYKGVILPQMLDKSSPDQAQSVLDGFTKLTEIQGQRLFPGQAPAGTAPVADTQSPWGAALSTAGNAARDLGTHILGGIANTVPAVIAVSSKFNPIERLAESVTGHSYINDFAQYLHGVVKNAVEQATSQQGLDAQKKYAEDAGKATNFIGHLGAIAHNPMNLPNIVGDAIGAMAPVVASGGLAGGATLADLGIGGLLGDARLATVAAGGVTGAGSAGVEGEAAVRNASTEQLLKSNPHAAEEYKRLIASGVPEAAADATIRNDAISRVWNIQAPVAGLVSAAGAGIGAETLLAKRVGGKILEGAGQNLVKRLATGATVEGASNAALSVPSTVATNISEGNPLDTNMGRDAAVAGTVGSIIGASTKGLIGKRPVGKAKAQPEVPPPAAPGAATTDTAGDTGGPTPSTTLDIKAKAAAEPAPTTTVDTIATKLAKELDPNDKSKTRLKNGANLTPETLINVAALQAKPIIGSKAWDSLNTAQRADLVENIATRFTTANYPEDAQAPFHEAIAKWKADTLAPPEAATVVPPVAPQETTPPVDATPPPQAPNESVLAEARAQDIATAAQLEASQKAAKDATANTPPKPTVEDAKAVAEAVVAGTEVAPPPKTLKSDNKKAEKLFLDSVMNILSGRAESVPEALRGIILEDPRFKAIEVAFKTGKLTSADQVQAILDQSKKDIAQTAKQSTALEAAQGKKLSELTKAIKPLPNSSLVKLEVQRVLKEVSDSGLFTDKEIAKMTLAQAKEALTRTGGLDIPTAPPVAVAPPTLPPAKPATPKPVAEGKKSIKKEDIVKAAAEKAAAAAKIADEKNKALVKAVEEKKAAEVKAAEAKRNRQKPLTDAEKKILTQELGFREDALANSPDYLRDFIKSREGNITPANRGLIEGALKSALEDVKGSKRLSKSKSFAKAKPQYLARAAEAQKHADKLQALLDRKPESPKQEAPAKVGAAQEVSEASKANTPPSKPTLSLPKKPAVRLPASLDALAKLALRNTDVPESVKGDLIAAAKLAQESGDAKPLNELIKEHEIDSKTAKELRKLAQEEPKPAAKLEEQQITETIKEAEATGEEDLQHIGENFLLRNKVEGDLPEAPVNSKIKAIWEAVKAGTYTVEDAIRDTQELGNEVVTRAVGLTKVLARLNRAKIGATPDELRGIAFSEWLLGKSPHLADRIALTIRNMGVDGPAGNFVRGLIEINASGAHPRTIVHEILHNAERMMPEALQRKVREEYFARLANKRKQAVTNGNEAIVKLIDAIYAYNADKTAGNKQILREQLIQGALDKTLNAHDMYKYTEPSEYWAETASEILARRHNEAGHWGNQLKEWYREFVENTKKLFGKDNNAEVYKGLRDVLNGDGTIKSEGNISAKGGEFHSEVYGAPPPPDSENIFAQPTRQAAEDKVRDEALMKSNEKGDLTNNAPQRVWENIANDVISFENLDIAVRQRKLKQTFKTTMADAHRVYLGMMSHFTTLDAEQVGKPVRDYFAESHKNWGTSFGDAVKNANAFFGAKNLMERYRTAYLYEVKLPVEADLVREGILTDVHEGLDSKAHAVRKNGELSRLVDKYAETSLEEHVGENYLEQQAILREAHANGLNETTMAEFNKLLDPVRERMGQRMVESGQVAADDYVKDFYGWKWYVPQKAPKASSNTQEANAAFDFASNRPTTHSLHKEVHAMRIEAQTHSGFTPLDRLLIDLDRSGERAAYRGLTESAFELIVNNITHDADGKESNPFGAVITKFTGTPYKGYTDADGNIFSHLTHPAVGFIYHDGNSHYRVDLPHNSDLGRAFLAMTKVLKPPKLLALLGKGTSALARAYTTSSPGWQTALGMVRELTALPLTVGAEIHANPLKAARLMGAFYKNVALSGDSIQNLLPTILDGKSVLGKSFDKGANDTAEWVRIYRESGGSMDINQLYQGKGSGVFKGDTFDNLGNLLDSSRTLKEKAEDGFNVLVAPLEFINHYTSNYAQFLETVPRAMMFKALVEVEGLSHQEAAVRVRSVMDFAQTGLWGRNMNAIWAFSKTSFTSMDTVRRIFRDKQTGGIDYKKTLAWSMALSGLAASGYGIIRTLMGKDDDGTANMDKISISTLTQSMIFPMGKDKPPIKVAIGLGLPQLLMAPGIIMAAIADGHITLKEGGMEMFNVLQRNGPIKALGEGDQNPADSIDNLWRNLAFTTIAPLVAIGGNKNTFGGDIHTKYGKVDVPNYDEGKANTSPVYRDIAKFIEKITGQDFYPEDVRSLMINYGGQNARDILASALDNPAKKETGYTPSNPLVGRFVADDAQYYATGKVQRTLAQAGDVMANVTDAVKEGASVTTLGQKKAIVRQYLAAHPAEAKVYAAHEALSKAQKQYSIEVRKISRDSLTSVTRKQFLRKELDSKMNVKVKALQDAMDNL